MPDSDEGFNPPNEVHLYVTCQHGPCVEQGVAAKREAPWQVRLSLLASVMNILYVAVKILMTTGMA